MNIGGNLRSLWNVFHFSFFCKFLSFSNPFAGVVNINAKLKNHLASLGANLLRFTFAGDNFSKEQNVCIVRQVLESSRHLSSQGYLRLQEHGELYYYGYKENVGGRYSPRRNTYCCNWR